MIKFPTVIVDNFYKEPDKVREFALKQDFLDSIGYYPGKRTKQLYELNRDLFIGFCSKLFSLYYPPEIKWIVKTSFWKVSTLDSDPLSPKNIGWIHEDGCLAAGVVYLTPGFNNKLGTTIYKQVKEKEPIDDKSMYKFYASNIDENFDANITKNNSAFEETTKISNHYNRLICFDGSDTYHSPSHYYMGNETRLVQVFFVHNIESSISSPMQRIRDYDNIPYDSL
jgi:hypothetical protein